MKKFTIKLLFAIIVVLLLTPSTILAETTDEVRQYLELYYVDEIPQSTLEKDNIDDMMKGLDRYSSYMTEKEYQSFINSIERNSYSGIGVAINESEYGIEILSVFPSSPAEEAGIRVGDHITEVEGESIAGVPVELIISKVRGEAGTTVKLKIYRPSTGEEIIKEVTRIDVQMPTVEYDLLRGDIGYIRLNSFNDSAVIEMKEAIKELDGVKGWIVDLRDNPGGYLGASQQVAGLFPNVNQALITESKSGGRTVYNALKQEVQFKGPIHLLINQYSASASEIVAAAVKDQQGATIYGQTSFGKGSVQTIITLENGDALKITTARFYSPDGNSIYEVGVAPHVQTPVHFELEYALKDLLLAQERKFTDSSRYEWAEEAIEVLGKMEVIQGKNAELFDPSSHVTRAEFAILVSRLFGLEGDKQELPFEDVAAEAWYSDGVAAAYAYGLIEGKSTSTFDPNGDITREEIATIVGRMLELLGYEAEESQLEGYEDVATIASWAKASVYLAKREGIMNGVSESKFAPKEKTTRAQAATILYRLFFK